MKTNEYMEDLRIREDRLDVEWLEQPLKFMKYAELQADASRRLREAEEKIKVVRSELSLEAAEQGEKVLGAGVKPTAGNVEAYYRNHPDHIAAKVRHAEIQYEVEMLTNAVFAFHQRKSALENLVRLHGQSYFAEPSTPSDLSDTYKEHRKEQLKEVSSDRSAAHTKEVIASRRSRRPD